MHDPPHGAKQPHKRRDRAHRGQNRQAALQGFGLFRNRHIHRTIDARLCARDKATIGAQTALPFDHACGKDPLRGPRWFGADLLKQLVQRLARPKGAVKHCRLGPGTAIGQGFLNDDRPRPKRGAHQHEHHKFNGNRGAREKRPHREINLLGQRKGFCFHLPARCFARFSGAFAGQVIAFGYERPRPFRSHCRHGRFPAGGAGHTTIGAGARGGRRCSCRQP